MDCLHDIGMVTAGCGECIVFTLYGLGSQFDFFAPIVSSGSHSERSPSVPVSVLLDDDDGVKDELESRKTWVYA